MYEYLALRCASLFVCNGAVPGMKVRGSRVFAFCGAIIGVDSLTDAKLDANNLYVGLLTFISLERSCSRFSIKELPISIRSSVRNLSDSSMYDFSTLVLCSVCPIIYIRCFTFS